jgi:hypothetical protein
MTIRLQIGSLVLEGVRPAQRDRVAAAFERELARLLSQRDAWPAAGARGRPSLGVEHRAVRPCRADGLGRHAARAVFDALGSVLTPHVPTDRTGIIDARSLPGQAASRGRTP